MNFLNSKRNNNFVATVNSTLNGPAPSYNWLIYVLIVIIIIGLLYVYRNTIVRMIENTMKGGKKFYNSVLDLKEKRLVGGKNERDEDDKENIVGNWCYVGEDLTGRFCVKVPEVELCPKARAFVTRAECEMVKASPLPLTVQQDRGMTGLMLAGSPSV
jgi:hypothetical protein